MVAQRVTQLFQWWLALGHPEQFRAQNWQKK
jgi:hypothetical protein